MATEVIMPQMGESIAEGTITKWLVAVGDTVQRDEPLFEISTDKVDAEIPSPASGVLLEIKHPEGSTVQVDAVVALIGEAGERSQIGEESRDRPADESESLDEREKQAAESEDEVVQRDDVEKPVGDGEETPAESSRVEPQLAERVRKMSSPLVRRMAQEEGIDLSEVSGTGIHGRVTKNDLLEYLENRTKERPTAPARMAEVMASPGRAEAGQFMVPAFREGENVEIEPMSNIRKLTAAHMAYSKRTSAHVTTVFHMDLSRVAKVRQRSKDGFLRTHGTKLTFMPFIFKAVANALIANPKLNASIDGTDVVFKKDINLGMAVALDWGLLVPVIRHADGLNLVGLAKTANDLAVRARKKKLSPDEIQGGTFTITNPGVFGSLFGTPIINQPQVGILGVGAIEKRPVVETDSDGNDTIAIKNMAYFAITYDHRLVDGADADQFMNHIKQTLLEESWSELDPFA
ncbi:MAG: 2-oxoglutarate dehydrogenase, E2 component, dihydrolipoamide succinyltransferase [Acidobacteriota bacterium]